MRWDDSKDDDLIRRGDLKKKYLEYSFFPALISNVLQKAPAVDAVAVKHARWVVVNEHMWRRDESGEIDIWAWDGDFHNGPLCKLCHSTPCIYCRPNWENSKCDVTSYKCSECNYHVEKESAYCPDCGAKMDGEV